MTATVTPAVRLQVADAQSLTDIPLEDLDVNGARNACIEGRNRSRRRRRQTSANLRSQHGQMDGDEPLTLKVYTQASSKITGKQIDGVRRKLKGFYDTPCEKWNSKPRKFPFKLVLQLLKVIVVTLQLSTFAEERSSFETFAQRNKISFHHVFLQDWGADREILPYPPGIGAYAVYTKDDLYSHINYVLHQYDRFSDVTLSAFRTQPNDTVKMTSRYYKQATLHPYSKSYDVDSRVETYHNLNINENCTENSDFDCYDIQKYLDDIQQPIDLARLTELSLDIAIIGINVKEPEHSLSQPVANVECVKFLITIVYDNSGGNGQIRISLKSLLDMRRCEEADNQTLAQDIKRMNRNAVGLLTAFDVFVLVICVASFTLALRSTIKRWRRMRKAVAIFEEHYGYRLTIPEMMDFLSMWYIQYMISDALVTVGTGLKLYLRFGDVAYEETFDNDVIYNSAAIALGIASLAQWIGLIRYLGFFNRYYILILTISNAVPALIRFLVCGVTIYLGFVFCGWVILGPYNPKFQTIGFTAQTLFSLMHGDEIYATMSIISEEEQPLIYGFSVLYLYTYTLLFIFAIANLFIAVITDSYECIKKGEFFKKSFLQHFVDDTIVVMGSTRDKSLRVYDELTEDEVDEQYGMLSPLLCCLDRCVHHSVNVNNYNEEITGDLRPNHTELGED